MNEESTTRWVVSFVLAAIQGGVLVLINSVTKTVFHTLERLTRLEEHTKHTSDRMDRIETRCDAELRERHGRE